MVVEHVTGILLVAGSFVEAVAGNVAEVVVAESFVEADAVVGHDVVLLHNRSIVVVPAVDEAVELPALVLSMDEASVVVEQEDFPRNPVRHPY